MVRSLLFPSVEAWSLLPKHAVFVWPNHYKSWAIPINIIFFEIMMLTATCLLFHYVRKYIFSMKTYLSYCKVQGISISKPQETTTLPTVTALLSASDLARIRAMSDLDLNRSQTTSQVEGVPSRTTSDALAPPSSSTIRHRLSLQPQQLTIPKQAPATHSRAQSTIPPQSTIPTQPPSHHRVRMSLPPLDLDLIRQRAMTETTVTDMIAPISPTHTTFNDVVFQQPPVVETDLATAYEEWSTPRVFAVCWPILETMVRPSVVILLVTLFQCLDFQLYIALFILSYCHELVFLYYWRRWYPRQHLVFMTRHHVLALTILTVIYVMLHVSGSGVDFPYSQHDPRVETLVFRGGYLFILWEWAFVCMAAQQLYTEYMKYQHDMYPDRVSSLDVYTGRRNSAIVCRICFMIWSFSVYVCSLFLPDVTYSLYLLPVVPGFLMNCFDTYYTLRSIQRLTKKMNELKQEELLKQAMKSPEFPTVSFIKSIITEPPHKSTISPLPTMTESNEPMSPTIMPTSTKHDTMDIPTMTIHQDVVIHMSKEESTSRSESIPSQIESVAAI